jgi:hypothetical protein
VAEVGIERFGTRHDQEDQTHHGEPNHAVRHDELHAQ